MCNAASFTTAWGQIFRLIANDHGLFIHILNMLRAWGALLMCLLMIGAIMIG